VTVKSTVQVRDIQIGSGNPLVLIGGPCVLEARETNFKIASELKTICDKLNIPYIFKASYDKGNRGVNSSYRGPMIEDGLAELKAISEEFDVPVITDVHNEIEAQKAGEVVDILQIPAYLCMQTSLIEAAAKTGKPLNVKKGQFLSPFNVSGIIQKVESFGNDQLMITERGTVFGYNNLVSDFKALPAIRNAGVPVVFDPTHIIRKPGISSSVPEGGDPEFVPFLARAATASGIDALFMETHPAPERALCDACSMYPLHHMEELLFQIKELDKLVKQWSLTVMDKNENGFLE
jgi:2-dehydro-3-deoxyphosphooctonate aldolase (KDO 8-P synthase)